MEVAQKFEEITGGKLVEGYGMSESSPLTAGNPIFGQTSIGSIGLPFPKHRTRHRRAGADEQGEYKFLDTGEEGELVVRGPQVMKGYYNNPEETRNAIDADGWLHTGDIARMDTDGYFYIVDRKKDLIIASGYNIVPREVEEVLFMHPKVMEAAVVGVPDPKRGETVKAFVVLKDGPERHRRRDSRLSARSTWPPTRCRPWSSSARSCPRPRSAKSAACIAGRGKAEGGAARKRNEHAPGRHAA